MSTPSMKPALPAGAILSQHAQQDFDDFHSGRPLTQRVMISVIQVGGTASETQERGRANKSKYETIHSVEITDQHTADHVRHLLTEARANRGYGNTEQGVLFASDDVTEQRKEQLQHLREWAEEEGVDDETLTEKWNSFHGGNYDARLEQAAPAHLREFAISLGALPDTDPDGDVVEAQVEDEVADDGDETEPGNVIKPEFTGAKA